MARAASIFMIMIVFFIVSQDVYKRVAEGASCCETIHMKCDIHNAKDNATCSNACPESCRRGGKDRGSCRDWNTKNGICHCNC
ncbi:hypothetical protein Scep_028559 [Stephania cephalantha]|uniref:Uncharacterized protein n=1 Tax=Stephania cephalantha TaxID=152367 RepID=A0AAP0EER9_9MAGN